MHTFYCCIPSSWFEYDESIPIAYPIMAMFKAIRDAKIWCMNEPTDFGIVKLDIAVPSDYKIITVNVNHE